MIIKNIVYGIILGIGFIIPGVSGGVLATIMGIYDEIIFRLNNFQNNIKDNIKYLLPLFIGISLSVFLLSKIILFLIKNKVYFISYIFMGLIIGTIPYLIREIKIKTHKNISFFPFFVAFLIGIFLFFIENSSFSNNNQITIFTMIIAGIFYAIGKIVPGISGAALLMFLGIYEYFLEIVGNPLIINLKLILPFLISFLISAFIIIKSIYYLLNNHFRITYSFIIGFSLSSVLFIYPGNISLFSLIMFILSINISYSISKKKSIH